MCRTLAQPIQTQSQQPGGVKVTGHRQQKKKGTLWNATIISTLSIIVLCEHTQYTEKDGIKYLVINYLSLMNQVMKSRR